MKKEDAVKEAVDWAIDENLLGGYFKENREKVIAMTLAELEEEEWIHQLRAKGRIIGRNTMIKSLYEQGVSKDTIAVAAKITATEVDDILLQPIEVIEKPVTKLDLLFPAPEWFAYFRLNDGIEQGIESMVIYFDKQGFSKETIAAAAKITVWQVEDIIERAAVTA